MKVLFAAAVAIAFVLPTQAQTVIANPEAGTADAGVASRPIANVAANDTVDDAPATLGSGGNATIAKSGAWASGLGLNTTTGAVSTTIALPTGIYNVDYKLCNKSAPTDCAIATDTVTVITPEIVPNPDSGTAAAGIASRPIANVAANDTINSAPATLGAAGNASIGTVGSWPTGITLTPSTGAVSTTVAVMEGEYAVQYRLCDKNVPAVCATTTDTVTVITPSIVPVSEQGTSVVGYAAKPIANVAANDIVNGLPAQLGANGNASVSVVGSWPSGIALNRSTGAITVTTSVAMGSYSVAYQLCDRNVPAVCAVTTDTINVVGVVVANAESGTVVSGKASTPIVNVVANDTVIGVKARLVTSPNATVTALGTWPTGLTLNTANGAIKASTAVAPGMYFVDYELCDKKPIPNCTTATDQITASALIVALPVSGSAVAGTLSIPIGNVNVKNSVNGAAVVLGGSGNSTISPLGTWPDGIVLMTSTGAIRAASNLPIGTYSVPYQLCDLDSPANCASTFANVIITPPFDEVLVSEHVVGDIEFDWGRNGLNCPTCNGGQGNMQFHWTDRNNRLWIGSVDPNTGLFTPVSGRKALVDDHAFFWQDWGNGPEWALSTPPGSEEPISQLVYTRFTPGQSASWQYAGAGMATYSNGAWTSDFLPGAISPGHNTVLPTASQCTSDPRAMSVYLGLLSNTDMYTEPVSTDPGTTPTLAPIGTIANGIGERFVACTDWLTFQGVVTIGTNTLQQVFWYDIATQVVQQLTFDPTTKQRAVMFRAPELLGQQYDYMLITLAKANQIQIYRQTGVSENGAPVMALYNVIYSPDPVQPYMFNPKVFIHCNPTCHTYVLMGLSNIVNSQQTQTQPNGMGLTNIDPDNPMFQVLASSATQPYTQRLDPEYFITANGPYVYYQALLTLTPTEPYASLGYHYIDLKLGPPSGPCVGSSAEGGLVGSAVVCR